MSFITRCPACATAFKVVPDQLKISDGWVRCGRCQQVFDATLDLQPGWPVPAPARPAPEETLLAEAPVSRGPLQSEAVEMPVADPVGAVASTDGSWPASSHIHVDLDPAVHTEAVSWPVPGHDLPAPSARSEPPPEPVVEEADPEPFATTVFVPMDGDVEDASWLLPAAPAPSDLPVATPEPGTESEPNPFLDVVPADTELQAPMVADAEPADGLAFVRQAQRKAFWRRAPVRLVLWFLVLLLLGALVLQWTWLERDRLAARSPVWRDAMVRLCAPIGCEVGDWRAPDMVHIDSSALLRRSPGRYVFDLVLKNSSRLPVAVPAVELALTDAADVVLVRRVLLPQEWSPATTALAGGTEQSLRLELALPGAEAQVMTGYRALLFYP